MSNFGGMVKIEIIDKKSGKILDRFGPDKNMVVDEGVEEFWRRLSMLDSGNARAFNSIALGIDYGDPADWTEFNPEPPNRTFGSATQTVIYFTPFENMTFEQPVDNILKITGMVDGVEAMTQSFPTEYSAVFNSATLRFGNDVSFAFKRFPARYISRDVDIRIVWTLTMQNARTFCGFADPVDDGNTKVYFGSQIEIFKLNGSGDLEYGTVNHSEEVSALAADIAGFVYSGDVSGLLIKQDMNRNEQWLFNKNAGAVINRITYDNRGNVYTSATNGQIKKITEYAAQVWSYEDPDGQFVYLSGVDDDLNVYFFNSQTAKVTKLSPIGNVQFENTDDHPASILDASTSRDGNTFTIASDEYVRMLDSGGSLLWETLLDDTPSRVSFDPQGFVVIGFNSGRLEKFDLGGVLVWSLVWPSLALLPDWTVELEVDNDGTIFVATRNQEIHRVSRDGVLEWTHDDALDTINCIAVNRN